jgi:hypothetical protein
MALGHESTNPSLNESRRLVDHGPRLARSKGYGGFSSRSLIYEWTACVASSCTVLGETGEPRDPPWPADRAALSRAMRHHLLIRGDLRVLGDERDPIYPLTAVETSHRKRATGRQLDQCMVMVREVFMGHRLGPWCWGTSLRTIH